MSFEEAVIQCGAPALCGIKPSCLFSIRKEVYDACKSKVKEWHSAFAGEGKYIVALPRRNAQVLFFVYDKNLLERQCGDWRIRQYLKEKSYPVESGFYAMLSELLHRLAGENGFPHEVGVFLGYPLEDVVQFEKTAGGNYRYAGFWKVYGDVHAARKRMEQYRTCSAGCRELLKRGLSVPLAAKKYARGALIHNNY